MGQTYATGNPVGDFLFGAQAWLANPSGAWSDAIAIAQGVNPSMLQVPPTTPEVFGLYAVPFFGVLGGLWLLRRMFK